MTNWIGPITYYVHNETDEDPEQEVENGVKAGLPKELAYHLANTNPLYEFDVEFYVNPEYERYFITAVDFGKAGRIERELPLSPLGLGTCPIHIDRRHSQQFFDEYPEDFFDAQKA